MRREFSAGGVLVRRLRGPLDAGRDPARRAGREGTLGAAEGADRRRASRAEADRAPGGGRGDRARTAARSASSATSATGSTGRASAIFKVVSFFLVRYAGGRLGDVPPEHRHEVAEVRWLPLDDAPRLLAYGGEREMAAQGLASSGQDV